MIHEKITVNRVDDVDYDFNGRGGDCFISQLAISQQLQLLEKELGVTLLLREDRKCFLTLAGDFL
ncbi:MAG: LysR family transcriptional regulator [Quinella sp. 1Q5]|nr:LysR family transcriptional regulator [Quinella sp. 1Q5]